MLTRTLVTGFVITWTCFVFYGGGIGCDGNGGGDNSIGSGSDLSNLTPENITLKLVRLDGTKLDLTSKPIPIRVALEVTFPTSMNTLLVGNATSIIDPDGKVIEGTKTWNSDKTVLTLTPQINFRHKTTYRTKITVASSAGTQGNVDIIDRSFLTMTKGDVNGDGSPDIVVEAAGRDGSGKERFAAYIFNGASLIGTLTTENKLAALNLPARIAGDVNADGYADLVAGEDTSVTLSAGGTSKSATIYIFSGATLSGLLTSAKAIATIDATAENIGFSAPALGAGDLNGDGYEDIVVGGHELKALMPEEGLTAKGYIFVFNGKDISGTLNSAKSFATISSDMVVSEYNDLFTCDIDADMFNDIVTNWHALLSHSTYTGAGYIFSGKDISGSKTTTDAVATISGINEGLVGPEFSCIGDINSDGQADLAAYINWTAGSSGTKETNYIFNGTDLTGSVQATKAISVTRNTYSSTGVFFGSKPVSAGDIDKDGHNDIIFGKYIFSGAKISGQLAPTNALAYIDGVTPSVTAGAGDINADGYDDIIVGVKSANYGDGAAYIFSGKTLSGPKPASDAIATITCAPSPDIHYQIGSFVGGVAY